MALLSLPWLGLLLVFVRFLSLRLCASAWVGPHSCPTFSRVGAAPSPGFLFFALVVGDPSTLFILICLPSGCGHPFGSLVFFVTNDRQRRFPLEGCFLWVVASHFGVVSSFPYVLSQFVGAPGSWYQRFSLACHCPYQYPYSPGFFCCFARCFGCAALLPYGCAHACCWAGVFFCFLPALRPPSGFEYTGSIGFSSPIEFPTFAMGSPLRGRGLSVLDRNEGLVSPLRSGTLVRSWLDLPPLCGYLRAGPQGVLPGGAPLTVGLLPGSPTQFCPLSSGYPVGWGASPSDEASASSCRFSWRLGAAGALAVTLPEAASQRGFFPLCLILPLPGSVSFSRICSSVGGHVGVAHTFLPSLLLGGSLVRFCGGLCWRSLALSWAYPPLFLCVGLMVCSRRIVAPLAPCLSGRFPSLVLVSLCGGASPLALVP